VAKWWQIVTFLKGSEGHREEFLESTFTSCGESVVVTAIPTMAPDSSSSLMSEDVLNSKLSPA